MGSIPAHDKIISTYVYDTVSGGNRSTPKNSTTSALESLGVTLNFIYCRLKEFHHNYQVRWKIYDDYLKNLFKQIPTKKPKPLSLDKNTSYYW